MSGPRSTGAGTRSALVRPREAADLPGCVDGLAAVHRLDRYPTRWPDDPARWLTPPRLAAAWVVDDGEVQGHLALVRGVEDERLVRATGRPAAELVAVSRLFVRPAARGRGLGERLLRTAAEHAVRDGAGLVLEVVAEGRSAALRLYTRLGWERVGQRTASWTTPDGARPRLVLLRRVPGG